MPDTGLDSALMTQAVYIALAERGRFQIEWIIPIELEGKVKQFRIRVVSEKDSDVVTVPGTQLYYMRSNLKQCVFDTDVVAVLLDGSDVQIGSRTVFLS